MMETDLGSISYWLVFALLLAESTVIVGLFAPGVLAMVGGSFLAGQGILDPLTVFAVGYFGVALGDNIGYAVGRHSSRIARVSQYVSSLAERGSLRQKLDSKWLIFFQFPVVTRAPVPLLLGAFRLKFGRWILLDSIATLLFVLALFCCGFFAGRLAGTSEQALKIASYVQLIFLASLLLLVAVGIGKWYRSHSAK